MMKNLRLLMILSVIALLIAACGTVATPEPNQETLAAQEAEHGESVEELTSEEESGEEVAAAATDVPTATHTPEPPTATPTEVPPTATPAPTETPAPAEDPLVQLINTFGDPANGETIFAETYEAGGAVWACTNCHNIASEDRLIGPGMLNFVDRAGTRVEGQPAEVYAYNSIIHPNDYIVEGDPEYPANLMPQNYAEVFTDQELYDLVAYLLSLQG